MPSGSYFPPLIKEVAILKKDGGVRKLGIPTILDRIAQECWLQLGALAIYNHVISNVFSASEPFVGNNMWVAGLTDPDRYSIPFESPTDVPDETMLSDWVKTNKTN